jgi:error-prone DNA polymerase
MSDTDQERQRPADGARGTRALPSSPRYAELQCTSHFSFLRGASSCDELFAQAARLGIEALAITDHNSLAGIVRAHEAAQAHGVRLIVGCRLDLRDGLPVLVYPTDRPAYAHLCRLLSLGKKRGGKAKCLLDWADLAAFSDGLIAVLVPDEGLHGTADVSPFSSSSPASGGGSEKGHRHLLRACGPAPSLPSPASGKRRRPPPQAAEGEEEGAHPQYPPPLAGVAHDLRRLADIFGDRAYLALTLYRRPNDALRLHALTNLAAQAGVATVATNDVLFHTPDRRILQDVVSCIRHNVTIDELGFRRERHADRYLKPPLEMARLFGSHLMALARTVEIAERCRFSLNELAYQYPHEVPIPGLTAQQALERLTWEGADRRYPGEVPEKVRANLRHELELIEKLGYAPYFLTVDAIVRFARSQDILCQGRGSAANSAVCYVLGITSIDPDRNDLLFERFVSQERREPPDIDVDFEHERRETVMQWVFETYGRDRAALCSTVIRYRAKGAIRDVGKALGLTEDLIKVLSSQVWGWSGAVDEQYAKELNLNLNDRRLRLALELANELIGAPRHLSQHPGGFVLTRDRLDDLVPIEPAAMTDRQVIEWDKDDIDVLRFMKVDCLALGMLSCMKRSFDLLAAHKGLAIDLATIPAEDAATYDMICKADTVGVFQIESRAQMSMLPRMKPRTYYDLVIEVAIVRPGPIQGDMVHPYLRRREGKEPVEYPRPELERVLGKTLGVPLFQEQAMRVAIECAGFTPGEADQLRRAMATFKHTGGVSRFAEKLIAGMVSNGYTRDFAMRTFRQLEGFGSYGFPESHAASFALIAYASSWMKCRHPDVFCAALLNAQPMGFYAPAQLVRDARQHGVEVRPVCINASQWDCTLEPVEDKSLDDRNFDDESLEPQTSRTYSYSTEAMNEFDLSAQALLSPQGGRGSALRQEERTNSFTCSTKCGQTADETLHRRFAVRLGLRMIKGLSQADANTIVTARADRPFTAISDVWRRAVVPVAALVRVAEADAFRPSLKLARREALWAIRALRDEPLPLFEANSVQGTSPSPACGVAPSVPSPACGGASFPSPAWGSASFPSPACGGGPGRGPGGKSRACGEGPLPSPPQGTGSHVLTAPEFDEPAVTLKLMMAGAEVVKDYSHVGLTLRSHPVAFLRGDLNRRHIVTCAEAMQSHDGRRLTAAGIVLVRQMPGSAKGVMFITIEDETGIANIVVWPKVFERQRRAILASGMMAVTGRIQRADDVVHLVAHRLTDLSADLANVGDRDFPLPHGRGDELHHGSPGLDPRSLPKGVRVRNICDPYGHSDRLRVKARDFR